MKRFHLSFLFILVMFSSAFSQKEKGYRIKVRINGLKDTTLLLANHFGNKQYIKDTVKLDGKGTGVFDGKERLPGGVYLVVLPKTNFFEIIIGDEQHFSIENDTNDFVTNMKVTGSKENQFFYDYMRFITLKQKEAEPLRKRVKEIKNNKDSVVLLQKRMKELDDEVRSYMAETGKKSEGLFFSKMLKAMTEVEVPEAPLLPNGKKDSTFAYRYYKEHFFDHLDMGDDRFVNTNFLYNRLKSYFENMIVPHWDTIIKEADVVCSKMKSKELMKYTVWYITYTYETSKYMGMENVFVHMAKNYYMTKRVELDTAQLRKVTERAMILDPVLIGKKIPPLMLPDTNGNWVHIHKVEGKKTILVFWDPTCGHCKKEVPRIHEAYKKYKSKGLEVYAVNIEPNPEEWKKFVKEHNLDWINVINFFDGNKRLDLKKDFDIFSTPVVYLLDEKKIIQAKRIDAENVEKFLIELDPPKAEKK